MPAPIHSIRSLSLAAILLAGGLKSAARAEDAGMTNLSLIGRVQAGSLVAVGFTVPTGSDKTVLMRVAGPALAALGVDEALLDPKLELYDGGGNKLGENDDFHPGDAPLAASVGAFPFAADSKDAMLIARLTPGTYTIQASGNGSAAGVALVEVYDLSTTGDRLGNLSSRARLTAGDGFVVAGFTVAPGPATRRFLLRAVGAGLRGFDMIGALKDPKLEVFAGPRKIAENDNWDADEGRNHDPSAALTPAFLDAGAFPLVPGSSDAALLVDLPAGSYSMQARSVNGSGGAILMEAYELSPTRTGESRPVANLEVRDFRMMTSTDGYFHHYSPRLHVVETTGRSDAVVVSMELRVGPPFVPPGETWKLNVPIIAGRSVTVIGTDIHTNLVDGQRFGMEWLGGASSMRATITYRVSDGSERVVTATSLPLQ